MRQLTCSANSVPAGTPSIFATVCPSTISETACASLPLSATVLAIRVAVPKNAPCGSPEMNRAAISVSEFGAKHDRALPAKAITMNTMTSRFGRILRPNTSISVPTHTPMA